MSEREIPKTDRQPFLATFSRVHDGALVTVRIGTRRKVVDQKFRGLRPDGEDIIVRAGRHTHRVRHVEHLTLQQSAEDADAAVSMTTDDGEQTEVRLRWPMRAEVMDPAVE